jgi:hypothetical protein
MEKNIINKFFDKYVVLDKKTGNVLLPLFIPWAILYLFVISPWIVRIGGRWGLTLVGIGVPLGCAVVTLIVGGIAKIVRKK